MIEKKFRAMFFWRNRKIVGVLDDLSTRHIQFDAARCAAVFAHLAGNDECRFLAQRLKCLPKVRRYRTLHDHSLHDPGAVTQLWEHELAARTHVIKPAF